MNILSSGPTLFRVGSDHREERGALCCADDAVIGERRSERDARVTQRHVEWRSVKSLPFHPSTPLHSSRSNLYFRHSFSFFLSVPIVVLSTTVDRSD